MDKTLSLKANTRTQFGRKIKTLRDKGNLPANVYGKGKPSTAIEVSMHEFKSVYDEAGETGLVELLIDDSKNTKHVLIGDVKVNPVYGDYLHVDFREVDLSQKISATVPVEITGESPIEKSGEGSVVTQLFEVEVEALPTNLPESFIVDVSNLIEVDQAIYVKDLSVDKSKVEILTDSEAIVVKVEPPQKEEVVEVAPVAEGEEGAETPAEGETPEGEATPEESEATSDTETQN